MDFLWLNSTFLSELIQVFIITKFVLMMDSEDSSNSMTGQEQIMIFIDDLYESQDIFDLLGSEQYHHKHNTHEDNYATTTIIHEHNHDLELKISNTSTATNHTNHLEPEIAIRKCQCNKSRCLKNYCECFRQGLSCTPDCECLACGNRERLFLTRSNPMAIKCKCQKSHCLKNYCECHSAGKKCGKECKCSDCQNLQGSQLMQAEQKKETEDFDHQIFFNI